MVRYVALILVGMVCMYGVFVLLSLVGIVVPQF